MNLQYINFMKKIKNYKLYVYTLILIAFIFILYYFLISKNNQIKTFNSFKNCKKIEGIIGAEDIKVDNLSGLAFISSNDRRAYNKKINIRGNIFLIDLNSNDLIPINITTKIEPIDFHPVGISLIRKSNTNIRKNNFILYAINQKIANIKNQFEIVVFEFENNKLTYKKSISFPELNYGNSLINLDEENKFIVSNEFGSKTKIGQFFEFLFKLPKSNVVYYDANTGKSKVILDNLRFANGLEWGANKKSFYIAESNGDKVSHYFFDKDNLTLKFNREFKVIGPDNLFLDNDENIWVASHINEYAFIKNAIDPKNFAPSKIVSINTKTNNIDEKFLSKGEDLSAASGLVIYKNKVLIGSTFDNKILFCNK